MEAIELGESYGLTLDPDQQATIHAALGERADGSWAAGEVGDFKGRQAGKNDTIKVRQIAGLELFEERLILHTAHEFATANEDFLRLVAIFEAYDELRKKVARIRYANGEQGIEYINGARLKYRARTGGAGRGFAEADLVIYDEAQHLHAEQLAASMPTMLVNPNFQAWFCGSGGFATSSQTHALRRRAILGDGSRLAYTENTAQSFNTNLGAGISFTSPSADRMLDHDVLLCHPGYANGRVPFETMKTMFDAMGAELFGREILCIWDAEPGDDAGGAISMDVWAGLLDVDSAVASHAQWSVSVSPDRRWSSIGVAGRRVDGLLHVAWRDRKPGTAWCVDAIVSHFAMNRTAIRIHKTGTEGFLIPLLVERGVEVVEVSSAEVAQATGQLIDAVNASTLRHLDQPSLDVAVRGAVLRMSSDGAALWSQRNSHVEITPLMAVTVALGGVPIGKVDLAANIW